MLGAIVAVACMAASGALLWLAQSDDPHWDRRRGLDRHRRGGNLHGGHPVLRRSRRRLAAGLGRLDHRRDHRPETVARCRLMAGRRISRPPGPFLPCFPHPRPSSDPRHGRRRQGLRRRVPDPPLASGGRLRREARRRVRGAGRDARSSSERKGRWGRFQERAFLGLFPLLRPLLPAVARRLLARDRRRFRPPAVPLVVVSHTALRLLALVLGQRRRERTPSPATRPWSAPCARRRRPARRSRYSTLRPPPAAGGSPPGFDPAPSIRSTASCSPTRTAPSHRALSGRAGDPLPECGRRGERRLGRCGARTRTRPRARPARAVPPP